MTLEQFKTTEFYKTMKQFYMVTPFRGVVMNEDNISSENWYRVFTYFYPNGGDNMKVIKC